MTADVDPGPTGMAIEGDPTFDEWLELGRDVAATADSSRWWFGDWLAWGWERFATEDGVEVSLAAALVRRSVAPLTPLDIDALRTARDTAQAFAPDRRRAGLSFDHHVAALTGGLPAGEVEALLDEAEREGLSVANVRSVARARANELKAASEREGRVHG